MLSFLSGTILFKKPTFLVLDVHGVGYKVHCTTRTLEASVPKTESAFYTHLAVREDALDLFGFTSYEELELFQLLIGISGIGPRSALGILSLDTPEKLIHAIAHGDVGYLTKVSGVGKKSAEKIVLELRDKVSLLDLSDLAMSSARHDDEDVLEALKALGYRSDEARDALRAVSEDIVDQSGRIKEALKLLSRK